MIDMTEGEAEYLKYRFKQYLGSVSREIQNRRLKSMDDTKREEKMGMTIDGHIKILKSYHNGFTGWAGNLQESIDVAVDIMRKYQKIEKIVKEWEFDHESMVDSMEKISEVMIEDGKIG